jgi:hypothetical protein
VSNLRGRRLGYTRDFDAASKIGRTLGDYPLPDGRLKLIDGHLRRDLDPDMEVDVEILDVNEEVARKVLLSKGSRDYLV